MIEFFKRLFGLNRPSWDCIEDLTGRRLDMAYWIAALGVNDDWPGVGDIIVHLSSDSMGASIRRDDRWRVKSLREPYATSFIVVNKDGDETVFHIHYLRKHPTVSRVWLLMD